MYEAIKNFNKQFEYAPQVQNAERLGSYSRFAVLGMGGSHLAADILKSIKPTMGLVVHRDYGLPRVPKAFYDGGLVIASSYSGNTEEVIDGFMEARAGGIALAVISVGGKLLELAREFSIPYVQLPNTGIQPRSALGFSLKALLKITGEEELMRETEDMARVLSPQELEAGGKDLARRLKNFVPVLYSSEANYAVAYNWKIKFNETGKIPAFYNVIPELNHNEMTGFDAKESSRHLSKNFYFILIKDSSDHPLVIKRMEVLEGLYKDRGLRVEIIRMEGTSRVQKIFSSLVLADWAAYYTAEAYGLESEQVPMVEEFKSMVKG